MNTSGMKAGLNRAGKALKGFSKSMGRSTKDLRLFASISGGMTGKLGMMSTGLGTLTSVFGGVSKGIRATFPAWNGLSIAIAATGVGLLVIALGLLVAAFTQTQTGMDFVTVATEVLGAVFNTIIESVGFLSTAIWKLFSRDFEGAAADFKKAGQSILKVVENGKKGLEIGKQKVELEIKQLEYTEKIGISLEKEGLLREKAKNKEKFSAKQRLGFIEEEQKLQRERMGMEAELRDLNLDILDQKLKMTESTRDESLEFAKIQMEHRKALGAEAKQRKELIELRFAILTAAQKEVAIEKEKAIARQASLDLIEKEAEILDREPTVELVDVQTNKVLTQEEYNAELEKTLALSYEQNEVDRLAAEQFAAYATKQEEFFEASGANWINNLFNLELNNAAMEKLSAATSGALGILSKSLSKGAKDFSSYAKSVGNSIRDIIGMLLAKGVAAAIGSLFETVPWFVAAGLIPLAVGLVKTAFNAFVPAFAGGGIVGGTSYSGDKVSARVNSGEMILNSGQQRGLFDMLNGGSGNAGALNLTGVLRGEDIYLSVQEQSRIQTNTL